MNDLDTKIFYLEREIVAWKRVAAVEKRLADVVKAADMVEAMCDKEIAELKDRIRQQDEVLDAWREPHIEDEDGTIAHMAMLERRDEEAAQRNGSWCEDPAWD